MTMTGKMKRNRERPAAASMRTEDASRRRAAALGFVVAAATLLAAPSVCLAFAPSPLSGLRPSDAPHEIHRSSCGFPAGRGSRIASRPLAASQPSAAVAVAEQYGSDSSTVPAGVVLPARQIWSNLRSALLPAPPSSPSPPPSASDVLPKEVASAAAVAAVAASTPAGAVGITLSCLSAPSLGSDGAAASEPLTYLRSALSHLRTLFASSLVGARFAISQSWWCFPFCISLFPLYYLAVAGTTPPSPSWWSMPTMTEVVQSPSAEIIVGGFLLSNISYFLCGLYLLDAVPRIHWRWDRVFRRKDGVADTDRSTDAKEEGREATSSEVRFSDAPLLGTLTILCGVMSVLYHTFQTVGPHHVAETFYYIDHGFAISSILYFLRLCGMPGKKTMALAAAGFVMLATGSLRGAEAYAWIHSAWHFLSAGASVSWAHDGVRRGGFVGLAPDDPSSSA